MTTLADKAILSSADNRPHMLEKDMYDSWKSRMELYMMNRQHGRMILESVENGPLLWPSIKEKEVIRPKKYSELSATEAIQADCDVKATNIILQGLLPEGESLREFYLRFSLLLIDMNIYNMKLEQFQLNTKFLNTLPSEWSKFVTDVKLIRDLHTTNVDQLHAYLGQHEFHANKVRLMHERNSNPLALVATHQKARRFETKLYDGSVIQKTSAIVIRDSEKTFMLVEESRSKMLLKQKDSMMSEKNNSVNSDELNLSTRPTQVEVPKEIPKNPLLLIYPPKLRFLKLAC
nr:hypothetical protein [Tanacetum cinerariifolium]